MIDDDHETEPLYETEWCDGRTTLRVTVQDDGTTMLVMETAQGLYAHQAMTLEPHELAEMSAALRVARERSLHAQGHETRRIA